jgi:hypothetical protein
MTMEKLEYLMAKLVLQRHPLGLVLAGILESIYDGHTCFAALLADHRGLPWLAGQIRSKFDIRPC